MRHRVYRASGFLSSRPNWIPPSLHPASECFSPLLGPRGTETLVLDVYYTLNAVRVQGYSVPTIV